MYQEKVNVLWNGKVGPSYYRIGLTCHEGYSRATPGQFVMIRFRDQMTPFLRRPFSIHKLITKKDRAWGIELLCKIVGEGTQRLSMCKEGDVLDINQFHPVKDSERHQRPFRSRSGVLFPQFLDASQARRAEDLSYDDSTTPMRVNHQTYRLQDNEQLLRVH